MNLTKLEKAALNHYAYDEMNPTNGARPESADDVCCYVWADELAAALDISVNAAKGVVGSLVKKELAYVVEESDPQENGFGFTAAGFEAWAAIDADNEARVEAVKESDEAAPQPYCSQCSTFGHTSEDCYITKAVAKSPAPTMIIAPKTHKTSINSRAVLRKALSTFIAAEQNRLDRVKKESTRDECESNIAHAQDLLNEFSD